jgi:hypothetical protein
MGKRKDSVFWFRTKVIYCADTSLGHLGVHKCTKVVGRSPHMKNFGRKVRNFIVCCDLCQRI